MASVLTVQSMNLPVSYQMHAVLLTNAACCAHYVYVLYDNIYTHCAFYLVVFILCRHKPSFFDLAMEASCFRSTFFREQIVVLQL